MNIVWLYNIVDKNSGVIGTRWAAKIKRKFENVSVLRMVWEPLPYGTTREQQNAGRGLWRGNELLTTNQIVI